jgi:hypothetical protein
MHIYPNPMNRSKAEAIYFYITFPDKVGPLIAISNIDCLRLIAGISDIISRRTRIGRVNIILNSPISPGPKIDGIPSDKRGVGFGYRFPGSLKGEPVIPIVSGGTIYVIDSPSTKLRDYYRRNNDECTDYLSHPTLVAFYRIFSSIAR